MKFHRSGGFSLVELMVVISIVGLLAAIAVPNFKLFADKAYIRAAEGNIISIEQFVKIYKFEHDSFPDSAGVWINPKIGHAMYTDCNSFSQPARELCSFIPQLPDRINTACIGSIWEGAALLYMSDGIDYKVLAHCGGSIESNLASGYSDPRRPGWAIQVSSSLVWKNAM